MPLDRAARNLSVEATAINGPEVIDQSAVSTASLEQLAREQPFGQSSLAPTMLPLDRHTVERADKVLEMIDQV